jgi:hypothetical protein
VHKTPDRARWAALVALIGFAWWIVTVVALHILAEDQYDSVSQAISDLSLERFGFFLDVSFLGLGSGGIALALGLFWSVRRAVAAPILLSVTGVLWLLLGIFQTDPDDPFGIDEGNTEAMIHDGAAFASFILAMVVMFTFAWRFRRDERWQPFSMPTMIWAVLAVASFFLFPLLGDDGFGVAQRIYIGIWLSWLVVTAFRLWLTAKVVPVHS